MNIAGLFGRNLGMVEFSAGGDRLRIGGKRRLRSFLKLLMLHETDHLRHAVFGDDEIFGGETFNGLAAFILDGDRFDDELRTAGETSGSVSGSNRSRGLLAQPDHGQREKSLLEVSASLDSTLLECHPHGGLNGSHRVGSHG